MLLRRSVAHSLFKIRRSFERFVTNGSSSTRMALARGSALLNKSIQQSSDNHFDFSQNDDNFKKLAKGFQPSTPSYRTLVPEDLQRVAKAHWDHMDVIRIEPYRNEAAA